MNKKTNLFGSNYNAKSSMIYQNNCELNAGNYTIPNCNPKVSWYHVSIKPFISFAFSVILALSMSHLCEKYSSSNSFDTIKADLNSLRNKLNVLGNNLNSLTTEVKVVIGSNNEFQNNFKEIKCRLHNLSESLLKFRNEVSEETVSLNSVKELVKTELQTYDADKTGRTDYALESSGGSIISTRNTETYFLGVPSMTIFGIPICKQQNIPRIIIQKNVQLGKCWAFKGSNGTVVIKLSGYVLISGVSLEHIPQSISPNGDISSAPKDFSIRGLHNENDNNGLALGYFTYTTSGPPIQYFEVENISNIPFEIVELNILSNNGNKNYTCIYRVRVHGTLQHR